MSDRTLMASEALEDFKKYGKSKECRHYLSIIQSLRSIPCGVADRNSIKEFQDFIPADKRVGVPLIKVIETVFQFYIGYSQAMSDPELKKFISRQYARLYYQKNKEKLKSVSKKYYYENKNKVLKKNAEWWKRDAETGGHGAVIYRVAYRANLTQEQRKALNEKSKIWKQNNPDKVKEQNQSAYRRRKLSNKIIENEKMDIQHRNERGQQ